MVTAFSRTKDMLKWLSIEEDTACSVCSRVRHILVRTKCYTCTGDRSDLGRIFFVLEHNYEQRTMHPYDICFSFRKWAEAHKELRGSARRNHQWDLYKEAMKDYEEEAEKINNNIKNNNIIL